MAKITDFRELKRRQARKRGMKLLALIALVLVGTYLLSSIVNTPNFAGLSSVVDMIKGGPGYPIDAPGGKAKGMYQNESSLVMLNETTIYFYNTSGSEVYSAQHRMGNPQVETSGTMLLNYDRGSKTYAAYSRNNLFYSGMTDSAIRCGDISENGCIAIATQTENAQTQVLVMDTKQRELYTWKTDNAVTALAISDNGSSVAIASSYVEQGELKNALTIIKNGEQKCRYEIANQLILDLEFDGNDVRCITDRSAFILSQEGRMTGQFDYKGQSLAAFSMCDNGVILVFGDYEQDRKYTMASVASDFFTLNGTATLTDSLQKVKAYGNTILVLGASSFQQYSTYDCTLLKEESNEAYYDIQPMGNSIYAMTTTQIVRLPLEEPSKFSLFGSHSPQQLPDAEEQQQSQEELDLLQSILNGMQNAAEEPEGNEVTVGESEPETVYEEGFIETEPTEQENETTQSTEQDQTEENQEDQTTSPVEQDDSFDPDNPDGMVNQGPEQVPIQNGDIQPEFTQEESDKEQQDSSRRPAQDTPSSDETETTNDEDKKEDTEKQEEQTEESFFSSRRPAS